MVLVVAAIGISGSGKTTTLEYLISQFSTKGYRVGAVKHIHHVDFSIDKTGTNTWRFAHAGAGFVMAVSPREIDIIKKIKQEPQNFNNLFKFIKDENLDIVFIEGFHSLVTQQQDIIKIVTAKDQIDLKNTLRIVKPPIAAITGLVAQNSIESVFLGIPLVRIPREGEKLVAHLEMGLKQDNQKSS
ncbi:MAG: molybdopterin-guanine dinucleotide biosynthesis protein B [Nitrososphaerota archaeon]|jgi:molybdopterin-guanine dinucleotide biosynthesis protein MobB|nr:molybdopterin-guanine dinucleotide biosynthesis protein B [Nitrososphaerota archaeon]